MSKRSYRTGLIRLNKFQRRVVTVPFFSSLVFVILMTIFVRSFHSDLINVILYEQSPFSVNLIKKWEFLILFLLWLFFATVILWVYFISSNLVGAFERVLRELDSNIEKKEKKHIYARKDDYLANDLLKRINTLIDNLGW